MNEAPNRKLGVATRTPCFVTYEHIDSYLNAALVTCAASVIIISALAYTVRGNRWCLGLCGLVLLAGLLLATPALSHLLVTANGIENISELQKAALTAKINVHLVVLSVILGAVGANFLTTAITK